MDKKQKKKITPAYEALPTVNEHTDPKTGRPVPYEDDVERMRRWGEQNKL